MWESVGEGVGKGVRGVGRWEVSVGKCGKTCQVSMGVQRRGVG